MEKTQTNKDRILTGWALVYESGWWSKYSSDDFIYDALRNLGIDDTRATEIVDEIGEEYFELSNISTTDDDVLADYILKCLETF